MGAPEQGNFNHSGSTLRNPSALPCCWGDRRPCIGTSQGRSPSGPRHCVVTDRLMTYDELAEALGRSGEAVRALVIRKRWRRTLENDGRALWERRRERCGRSVRARAGSGAVGGATWRSLQRLPLQRRSRPCVSPIRQRYLTHNGTVGRVRDRVPDDAHHGPNYDANPSKWDSSAPAGPPRRGPPPRVFDPQGSRAPDRGRTAEPVQGFDWWPTEHSGEYNRDNPADRGSVGGAHDHEARDAPSHRVRHAANHRARKRLGSRPSARPPTTPVRHRGRALLSRRGSAQ